VANPSGSSGQAGMRVWPLQLQASPHPSGIGRIPRKIVFTLTKMSSNGEKASYLELYVLLVLMLFVLAFSFSYRAKPPLCYTIIVVYAIQILCVSSLGHVPML
jgi:hypothetical protein